jgi:2-dehydropantoate 2-reductase
VHVVVLGAGSIGSLLGGLLAATDWTAPARPVADDVAVSLLGRDDEHTREIRRDGLGVTHPDGTEESVPVAVATDESAVADADLLVVCVKSYDTEDAMAGVAPYLDGADVLTLQNGLGNAQTIAEYVPDEQVVVGTTSHGAVREAPGQVRHAGGGETTIGRYFVDNDPRVHAIADLLTVAGVETTVTDDPQRAVWTKVLVNAGINAPTALAGVPNGALAEDPAGLRLLRRAVEEGAEIAEASGVDVPGDVVERTLAVAERTATNRSSMRQDVERGRSTEVESLNGELARRASDNGVDAPVNETLADLIRLTTSD